jgi:hypothetical protein
MVVELGYDDLVTRPPASAQSTCKVERQGRHVRTECDLRWGGPEEIGQSGAGAGYERIGLLTCWIGPVRVGVVVEQIVLHRRNNRPRHLGPTGAVEIGDGLVLVSSLERRKLLAEERYVCGSDWYCCRCGHGLQSGWRTKGTV